LMKGSSDNNHDFDWVTHKKDKRKNSNKEGGKLIQVKIIAKLLEGIV